MKASARLALGLAIGIVATASAQAAKPTAGANPMDASAWEIGPITPTRNYSVNMPLTPSPHPDGWSFDFPQPDSAAGHVHYLTLKHGSLSGKSRIVLRYRIEGGARGAILPHQISRMAVDADDVFPASRR
jgi:hypothetical protein